MIISVSTRFKRSYKHLSSEIQEDFDKKIKIFGQNPKDIRLKTHNLRGRLRQCHAFCLRDGFRVLFRFSGIRGVDLLDIGPHDKYRQWQE